MKYSLLIVLGLLMAATPAESRPVNRFDELRPEIPDLSTGSARSNPALSTHVFTDTVSYGGTFWAPDSLRWEALRDSHWSFDTGVGSSINMGANPNKPVGYHQRMEGWYGIDQLLSPKPYFRRSSTCAIAGSFSMWAGVTLAEANALCFATGQGYGNSWNLVLSRSFVYSGSGNVTFSFQYSLESEPGFEYGYAFIDTTGTGSQDDVLLWAQDGLVSGTQVITLNPGQDMRSTPGAYVIRFRAGSDGSYSDEDGFYPTTCGMLALDNITVGADVSTFESDLDSWVQEIPTTSVGDFSDLADLADLSPPAAFCPCNLADSVLVFFDTTGEHPLDQDNIAASPWIDLRAGGDVGRPGKLMMYDVYANLPLVNLQFVQLRVRYYPEICSFNGLLRTSNWRDQNAVFYFGETPFCNPIDAPRLRDYSSIIPPGAEQVQIGYGVLDLCRVVPFGWACSGLSNQSPYFDNISLGVYGNAGTPIVATLSLDRFQDNFAADGTLNLASPGRIDQARVKNAAYAASNSILGDTLVARGNGGNTEVRVVFRVRPGPFMSSTLLASYAARWTAEPTLAARYGGAWYSARMDTAEQGGVTSSAQWMSTFHEADPGFTGNDRVADPWDPSRLANDIIPDHLFTPGSRLDYFVASRYRPPDPRNPGGTNWHTDPDTIGANFREVEILPSSARPDTTWNCRLYVDHRDDRDKDQQQIEEQGMTLALGSAIGNAEGTRYDRFDVQAPGSNQYSFGRPLFTQYGAGFLQMLLGYKLVTWHSGSLVSGSMTHEDAAIIQPWLTLRQIGNNHFWGSGENLAQNLDATSYLTREFLNKRLGTLLNCTAIRLANCGGAAIDTTYCLPTVAVAGSHFASTVLPRARGNGCPDLASFDLLSLNPAVGTAKGQLQYLRGVPGSGGAPTNTPYASITNRNTLDVSYQTVLDGVPVGRLRSNAGFFGAGCNDQAASYARTSDVLTWFPESANCGGNPFILLDVPDAPPPPGYRHALGAAYPNPMSPATRIQFTNGVANGRLTIDVFDVTGRRVRRLINGPMPAGVHEVAWDRTTDGGARAAAGLYFYRMNADGFADSRKLVVID